MIPNTLHFIWLGDTVPASVSRVIDLWRGQQGIEDVKLWSEPEIRELDPDAYDERWVNAITYRFFSNWARLQVLHHHGGIYLDTDMVPLSDDVFASFPFSGFDWVCPTTSNDALVDVSLLGSPQWSPATRRLLDTVTPDRVWAPANTRFLLSIPGNRAILDGKIWNSSDFTEEAKVFHAYHSLRFGMPRADYLTIKSLSEGKHLLEVGIGNSSVNHASNPDIASYTGLEFDSKWHRYYSMISPAPENLHLEDGTSFDKLTKIAELVQGKDVILVDSARSSRLEVFEIVSSIVPSGVRVLLHDVAVFGGVDRVMAKAATEVVDYHSSGRGLLETIKP
jgi:hypothetical protein